jgi:hypothetical protein
MLSERLFPSVVGQDGVSGCGFAVGHFLKFDILGFFQIDSSAGVNEGVLYRERNLQIWNRTEQWDIRFGGFRGDKVVGEVGPAGASGETGLFQ